MSTPVITIWQDKFGRTITRSGGYITFRGHVGIPFDIEDETMQQIFEAWQKSKPSTSSTDEKKANA